ncbi:hypothetical protein BD414DRAFT_214260 [Trametes punicea]|nr:hypothetical protein BD414DRAFT_214260 [Trametes punicea]
MLTIARIASLALLAFSFLTVVQASAGARRAATNAERLARGLGPARPKRLYNASRTKVARSAPSGAPGTLQTGVVAMYPAGTSPTDTPAPQPLGYMTQDEMTTNPAFAMQYQFTEPSSSSALLEITSTTIIYHLDGVATGSSTTLAPGSAAYVRLFASKVHTAPGAAVPVHAAEPWIIGYAQSTIWTVDDSGKLSVHWVNPDGSVYPQYFFVSSSFVYVTGDPELLQQEMGQSNGNLVLADLYFSE